MRRSAGDARRAARAASAYFHAAAGAAPARAGRPRTGGGGGALPLTFFDVPWIFTGPVERVFFYPYPHPPERFRAALLPRLVSSLSAALRAFYPLLLPGTSTRSCRGFRWLGMETAGSPSPWSR